MKVRAKWRVMFRFEDGSGFDLELEEYHHEKWIRPMRNPVHPGTLAKANLDELNISVAEAAKAMRVKRQQLDNAIQCKSGVSP